LGVRVGNFGKAGDGVGNFTSDSATLLIIAQCFLKVIPKRQKLRCQQKWFSVELAMLKNGIKVGI